MSELSPDERELLNAAARELKEAQEQKPQLEGLLLHPGWGILCRIAQSQIEARQRKVMGGPVGLSTKNASEQEWLKGEASGMRLLLGLPNLILEELQFTLETPNDATVKPTELESGGDPFAAGDS